MDESIRNRVLSEADYIITTKHTLRTTAKQFQVGKTTVFRDMTKLLKELDSSSYKDVRKVMLFNKAQRYSRGGRVKNHNKDNKK